MSNQCEWCNGTVPKPNAMCAGCKVLVMPFIGLHNNQIPSTDQRNFVNELIESSRDLVHHQRIQHLIQDINLGTALPPAFQSRRGPTPYWESESMIWQEVRDSIQRFGNSFTGIFPLPGNSILEIINPSEYKIDGVKIKKGLPLLDISEWLSNPKRAGAIKDWGKFILALSCILRTPEYLEREAWSLWMIVNSWRGINTPFCENATRQLENDLHPFQELIGKLAHKEMDSEISEPHYGTLSRVNEELIEEFGGSVGSAWLELLAGDDADYLQAFEQFFAPILVVHENRLQLIVLKDSSPAFIPLGNDPRIWRHIMSWALEPPFTKRSNFVTRLFWCWEEENGKWLPSHRQLKSARLLHDEIKKMGERSSVVPIDDEGMGSAIRVEGNSGLHYLIRSSDHPGKYMVEAYCNSDFLNTSTNGVEICIDPLGNQFLPAGDIAAGYLMALYNDTETKKHIITIELLLQSMEQTEITQTKSKEIWWMEVCELYENYIENMVGNGHFEEEFEHEEEPESEEELAEETEQYLEYLQFQEDQQQDVEPDQHAIEDYQNHLEEITQLMLEQNQVRGE